MPGGLLRGCRERSDPELTYPVPQPSVSACHLHPVACSPSGARPVVSCSTNSRRPGTIIQARLGHCQPGSHAQFVTRPHSKGGGPGSLHARMRAIHMPLEATSFTHRIHSTETSAAGWLPCLPMIACCWGTSYTGMKERVNPQHGHSCTCTYVAGVSCTRPAGYRACWLILGWHARNFCRQDPAAQRQAPAIHTPHTHCMGYSTNKGPVKHKTIPLLTQAGARELSYSLHTQSCRTPGLGAAPDLSGASLDTWSLCSITAPQALIAPAVGRQPPSQI
jgi:hypothetical protein